MTSKALYGLEQEFQARQLSFRLEKQTADAVCLFFG
jgi:hypothetical protein